MDTALYPGSGEALPTRLFSCGVIRLELPKSQGMTAVLLTCEFPWL